MIDCETSQRMLSSQSGNRVPVIRRRAGLCSPGFPVILRFGTREATERAASQHVIATAFAEDRMSVLNAAPLQRIYCAGPLFNQAERDEMTAIADAFAQAGHAVYLPHRDGMEFRLILDVLEQRGFARPTAAQFLHAAIFALDVYQLVVECDGLVWNLNGRVPDEGAVTEASIAWTLGKPMVAYMDDVRSLIAGRVNPMLVGMVEFTTFETIAELPARLAEVAGTMTTSAPATTRLPRRMQTAVADGRRLWHTMQQADAICDNELIAECVADLFAGETALLSDPPTGSMG